MKQTLKRTIPQPLWNFARDTYDAFRRIPELPDAYFHPWRRESIRRLSEMNPRQGSSRDQVARAFDVLARLSEQHRQSAKRLAAASESPAPASSSANCEM